MRKLANYSHRRGHHAIANLYIQRMDEVESDVRAIHDLIINGGSLEPVGQEAL